MFCLGFLCFLVAWGELEGYKLPWLEWAWYKGGLFGVLVRIEKWSSLRLCITTSCLVLLLMFLGRFWRWCCVTYLYIRLENSIHWTLRGNLGRHCYASVLVSQSLRTIYTVSSSYAVWPKIRKNPKDLRVVLLFMNGVYLGRRLYTNNIHRRVLARICTKSMVTTLESTHNGGADTSSKH